MTGKAPLEGDRISPSAVLPDFIAPADKPFFVTPRWAVRVFVGEVPACRIAWISAATEAMAIAYVHGMGFTDAVRYEVTKVEEVRAG